MNKFIQIIVMFCMFSIMGSCIGQKETKPSKDLKIPFLNPKDVSSDIDPYFSESTAINSTTGPKSIVRNIIQDKKGIYWLATWEGIIRYDGTTFTNMTNQEGLRRYRVFTMLEDRNGDIWFGTVGAGLYRYDGHTFTNYTTENGLVNHRTGCIMQDKKGNIWIGTEGGISMFDGRKFTNFTTENGMPNNDVNSIVDDDDGTIWIGARGEACRYDGKEFTRLINNEGLPFINVRTIIKDRKGHIWLGGNDGLWHYDGKSFTQLHKPFVGYIYEDNDGRIWTNAENQDKKGWVFSRYKPSPLPTSNPSFTAIKSEDNMFFGITEDISGHIWFGTLRGVYRYDGTSFENFQNP